MNGRADMTPSFDTLQTQAQAYNDLYAALLSQDVFGDDLGNDDPLLVIVRPARPPFSTRLGPALLILAALAIVFYVAIPRKRSR
jgi:hypothetical protein